ncbi:MAG TPA: glycine cleavage T C-terminal barrel domain-containing protein [Chthoniobacterales bacterium]|nr:glycine cleavage T C-terminal barrel domain-containing protein [Chthoniobacterales bacterium]
MPDRATGKFFDFSSRAKLRVSGRDRVRFLNGQVTNDIRKASESRAIEACILTAKGKMDAHAFVHAAGDCFLLDTEPELRESLRPRLERYIIADDVQVEDVTDKLSILHLLNADAPQVSRPCTVVSATRFAEPGWDIWTDAADRDEIFRELASLFEFCDADCAEMLRIWQGIPRWGRELSPAIIPVEANLDVRCIDYEKGCYIGQETISRMKMSGQQNKRLCGLIAPPESGLSPGMHLLPETDGKEVGWLTSVARSTSPARQIALGYVKRGFNAAGSRLRATVGDERAAAVDVEIVDLPFRD